MVNRSPKQFPGPGGSLLAGQLYMKGSEQIWVTRAQTSRRSWLIRVYSDNGTLTDEFHGKTKEGVEKKLSNAGYKAI